MRNLAIVILLTTVSACAQKSSSKEKVNDKLFAKGEQIAELKNKQLDEVSGLAASISNPGLLWTHNDSGNRGDVFLIDRQLNVKLKCELKGVDNRDWEDIAVGPGPVAGKNYVYVADIGDNLAQYTYKIVYRFEEPKLADSSTVHITNFDRIVFTLNEKKDSEALLLDPKSKDLYIISKRENPVYVYKVKYPYSTTDTVQALSIASLPYTQIVAGDFSPDGSEVLIKNYKNVYYWKKQKNETTENMFNRKPEILPYDEEPQGEAITFARDGSGYFTITEKVSGEKGYLQFYKRK